MQRVLVRANAGTLLNGFGAKEEGEAHCGSAERNASASHHVEQSLAVVEGWGFCCLGGELGAQDAVFCLGLLELLLDFLEALLAFSVHTEELKQPLLRWPTSSAYFLPIWGFPLLLANRGWLCLRRGGEVLEMFCRQEHLQMRLPEGWLFFRNGQDVERRRILRILRDGVDFDPKKMAAKN